MASDSTSTGTDDDPALAGAIVIHAQAICETADHLWRVLADVSIPTEGLTDHRHQHTVTFGTESMARVYIYQTIYDLTQSEVAQRLQNRPSLLKGFGLDTQPTQQTISYAYEQFSGQTKTILDAAATGIAIEARDHDVISGTLLPIDLSEAESDDDEDELTHSRPRARARQQGRGTRSPPRLRRVRLTQSGQQNLRGRADSRSVRHCLSHTRQRPFGRRCRVVPCGERHL